MRRYFLFLILLFLLVGCVPHNKQSKIENTSPNQLSQSAISSSKDHTQTIREKAPDFSLVSLNGEGITLSSFEGKYVILHFFSTWNPTTKRYLNSLQNAFEGFAKDEDVQIISIKTRRFNQNEKNKVIQFSAENHITFPILEDDKEQVMSLYDIKQVPYIVFIDPNGRELGYLKELVPGQLELIIQQLKEGSVNGNY